MPPRPPATPAGLPLPALGERICILGPSNSGKSTLAQAIGRKQALSVVHLDQLHHLPHTDWQARPQADFIALHDQAVTGERWVMDGNYSICLPQRLQRATGLIVLDASVPASLLRYVRRCLFQRERAGALDGGRDSVKWAMLRYIATVAPGHRRRYAQLFADSSLPKLYLPSMRALRACYRAWQLPPP